MFSGAEALQVERGPRLYGYGADSNSTRRLLRYISNTYGPVASFTGTPEARDWILTINATHFNESAGSATLPVYHLLYLLIVGFTSFTINKALFIFFIEHAVAPDILTFQKLEVQ